MDSLFLVGVPSGNSKIYRSLFLELLVPYPAEEMRMWEISPRVNSPKNDDPSLWEPVCAEPGHTTTDALELLRE
jgi:hypothetical protein